jgi:mRNA interferase MazF
VIQRGELWSAILPTPAGSGPGYRRPVLVVQSDEFNRSRINTVIAVALTSNLALAEAPGNVLLPKGRTKLSKDSVANVSQIITLDKAFLDRRISLLPGALLDEVEAGLRLILRL